MAAGGGHHEAELDVIVRAQAQQLAEIQAVHKEVQNLNSSVGQSAVVHERHAVAAREATAAEHDLTSEGNEAARAMGALGARGSEVVDRFTALGGIMGSSGVLGIGIGSAIVGVGALVEGTKSVIEISEKHERSVKDLEQAYKASGYQLGQFRGDIEGWIDSNKGFIESQDQAREGFAMMTRAGLDQNQVMDAMNVSLDLAALKHISLEDAERRVLLGLEGNARGLKELGIQLKTIQNEDDNTVKAAKNLEEANKKVEEATRAHDVAVRHLEEMQVSLTQKGHKPSHEELMKLEDEQKKVKDTSDALSEAQAKQQHAHEEAGRSISTQAKTLAELKEKTDDGRQSVTDLERSQRELNRAWEDFGNTVGPTVAKSLAQDIEWLLHMGDALGAVTSKVHDFIGALQSVNIIGGPGGSSMPPALGGGANFDTSAYYGRGRGS